jgi:hypothetical protein
MASFTGNWKVFPAGLAKILNGEVSPSLDDFYCILLSSSYTPVITDQTYGDISAYEIAQQYGYLTGGVALTNVVSIEESNGDVYLDCDDPSWAASGGSIVARHAAIYIGSLSANTLLATSLLDDTPADVTATDGNTLRITISNSGIYSANLYSDWN